MLRSCHPAFTTEAQSPQRLGDGGSVDAFRKKPAEPCPIPHAPTRRPAAPPIASRFTNDASRLRPFSPQRFDPSGIACPPCRQYDGSLVAPTSRGWRTKRPSKSRDHPRQERGKRPVGRTLDRGLRLRERHNDDCGRKRGWKKELATLAGLQTPRIRWV